MDITWHEHNTIELDWLLDNCMHGLPRVAGCPADKGVWWTTGARDVFVRTCHIGADVDVGKLPES